MAHKVKFDLSYYVILDPEYLKEVTLQEIQISIIESTGKMCHYSAIYNRGSKDQKQHMRPILVQAHTAMLTLLANITYWHNITAQPQPVEMEDIGNSVLLPSPKRAVDWMQRSLAGSDHDHLWRRCLPLQLNQALRFAAYDRVYVGDIRGYVEVFKAQEAAQRKAEGDRVANNALATVIHSATRFKGPVH